MEIDSLKVFVVDDESSIVEWIVNSIEWEVYNCCVAGTSTNGTDALRYMEKYPVDLLITDVCMPGVSGLDLIKDVKRLFPEMLIVVISAYDKFSYVKEAFRYGIINYCLKPIDVDELLECVKCARNTYEERRKHFLNRDRTIFRNNIFQRLINDENNIFELDNQCELAGINLNDFFWQLAIMDVKELEKSRYVYLVNYFREKENEGYYCFLDGDMNLVFCFFGKDPRDKSQDIRRLLERGAAEAPAFFVIGEPLQNYLEIAESYQVCRDFMNAGFLFRERVIQPGDYPYETYRNHLRSKSLEQWVNSLETYDAGSLFQILQKMVAGCRTEAEKKEAMICLTVFFIKNLKFICTEGNAITFGATPDVQATSEEMASWVKSFIRKNLNQAEDTRNSFHPYVKYAVQEIHTHYMDQNLSLQEIAKERCISASYLGRLFKAQTGEFFNEYLLKIRFKKTLEMLGNTKLNIKEIAETVGFSNQSYFNKKFRKIYGIAPVEYRRKFYEDC